MLSEDTWEGNSRNTVLDDGVHIQVTGDLACCEQRQDRLASRLRDSSCRRIRTFGPTGCSKSATQRAGNIVVDDGSSSASGPGQCSLQAKVAGPSRDQSNGSSDLGWEVGL